MRKRNNRFKYKGFSIFLAVFLAGTVHVNLPGLESGKNSGTVHAAANTTSYVNEDSNVKVIQQKVTMDLNKVWTISFNSEIDFNSVKDRVQVNEVNNNVLGSSVAVTVAANNIYSLKINPPSGGYRKGETYQITIKKGAESKDGKYLVKDNTMRFSIQGENTAIAKVDISPVLSMFKAITICDTTRQDIKKYKIEGNDKLFNVGETSLNVIDNKSSVQVYFYGNDGATQLGTTTLNVNSNSNGVPIQIQ